MSSHDNVVVLASTRTPVEDSLVRDWVRSEVEPEHRDVRVVTLPPLSGTPAAYAALGALLDDPDILLLPAHVVWRPGEKDGNRRVAISDLVRGRNPYDPASRNQRSIADADPDRAPVIAGIPGTVGFLQQRYSESHQGATADAEAFGRFVARRARLALERADRAVLGPEFRSPGFLTEEILHSAHFRRGLQELARRVGPDQASEARAEEILDELATGWGRLFVDLVPRIQRMVFQRGFDPDIDVVPAELDRLRQTVSGTPVIFLWSHRSNLDTPVLNVALHENGLPLPHLFAGINMAFGPLGVVLRRSGTIFIRRSFGGDELYKYVLKEFVGYLAEKRFNLSWSIEGTRSRTGKMLPPKLGLLGYTAEAYLAGRVDDISLQPVSITFDQLHEIGEYANYARGGRKSAEGMSWLLGFIKAQGERNFGKIYVRFPEPVSMRAALGAPGGATTTDADARRLALQKTAFEVAWRINEATPVTSVALVTSVLLGTRGMALTTSQVHTAVSTAVSYMDRRGVPVVGSGRGLKDIAGVESTLKALAVPGGIVTRVDGARDTVWRIGTDKQLEATFYRNSIIHVFLVSALCEMAIVMAAQAPPAERIERFWADVQQLRDLLKFEFYFTERREFLEQVRTEADRAGKDWEERLTSDPVDLRALLMRRAPLTASFLLRPFIEAYLIVADVVSRTEGPIDRPAVVKEALALGEQYLAQRRIDSAEPVSALLFETGLKMMDNRGLLVEAPDRAERVGGLVDQLERVQSAIITIERLTFDLFIADRRRLHNRGAS